MTPSAVDVCKFCCVEPLFGKWLAGGICESCLWNERKGLLHLRHFLGACKHGHPRNHENTYIDLRGYHVCRQCNRDAQARHRAKYSVVAQREEIRKHVRAKLDAWIAEKTLQPLESFEIIGDPMWDGIDPSRQS